VHPALARISRHMVAPSRFRDDRRDKRVSWREIRATRTPAPGLRPPGVTSRYSEGLTRPRAQTSGSIAYVAIPGWAATTAGMAFTAGIAVMIMPRPM